MYVSYNSLPTTGSTLGRQSHTPLATTLMRTQRNKPSTGIPVNQLTPNSLNRPGVECHKNFVNFNGNDNLLGSDKSEGQQKSCNVKGGDGGATNEEFPNYLPPTPIAMTTASTDARLRKGIFPRRLHQRNSMTDGEVYFYTGSEPVDDLIDLHPSNVVNISSAQPSSRREINGDHLPEYNSFNRANLLVNQKLKNANLYKTPSDFIPRSPNASAHRRKNSNANRQHTNFCDQIRAPSAFGQEVGLNGGGSNRFPSNHSLEGFGRSKSQLASNGGNAGGVANRDRKHSHQMIDQRMYQQGAVNVILEEPVRQDDSRWYGEDNTVHMKMNEMIRQKKSLRPRSYCGSYNPDHDYNTQLPATNYIHAPN